MATINDVCKLAGVSKATVSRVLNNTGQVKKSTADAVYQAMDTLGTSPIAWPARWLPTVPIHWGWLFLPLKEPISAA